MTIEEQLPRRAGEVESPVFHGQRLGTNKHRVRSARTPWKPSCARGVLSRCCFISPQSHHTKKPRDRLAQLQYAQSLFDICDDTTGRANIEPNWHAGPMPDAREAAFSLTEACDQPIAEYPKVSVCPLPVTCSAANLAASGTMSP